MRLIAAVLLALAAACATPDPTQLSMAPSLMIDQPASPFPYNSRFCP